MILSINYDLHDAGRDYDGVAGAIQSNSVAWAHPQGSLWFVDTDKNAERWIEILKEAGDSNDEYLVVRVYQDWASYGLEKEVVDWLKSPSRTW